MLLVQYVYKISFIKLINGTIHTTIAFSSQSNKKRPNKWTARHKRNICFYFFEK